ncbi:E3 ubiquitin-protein ligase TRIM9 [Ciona intestinalis]
MEEELQCPVCHCIFNDPVILPCTHNVCFQCANTLIHKSGELKVDLPPAYNIETSLPHHEPDKVSLLSETVLSDSDSGYSASSASSGTSDTPTPSSSTPTIVTSDPFNSLVPTHSATQASTTTTPTGVNLPALPESISCLTCPICHRASFVDDRGVNGLPRNKTMNSIVGRYTRTIDSSLRPPTLSPNASPVRKPPISPKKPATPVLRRPTKTVHNCQICEGDPANEASVKCLQCEVLYCASCRDRCHPPRGPLARHTLVDVDADKPEPARRPAYPTLPNKPSLKNGVRLPSCSHHPTERTSLYCSSCHLPLCVLCQDEGRHKNHDLKPIGALYKSRKGQLSQQMSSLSSKARQAKDLVMSLRGMPSEIEKYSTELESKTVTQLDHLMSLLQRKKDELLQKIAKERETKCKIVQDQLQQSTMKLRNTTGLLEYCIEVMKDNDPSAFLQVSQSLTERVSCNEQQWNGRNLISKTKPEFDMDIVTSPLAMEIENLDFFQMKVPGKPSIRADECGARNNTVTLSWLPAPNSIVDSFRLEMDDGNNGSYREVYAGKETVCTVDGLHFNSVYRARVRAVNKAGPSPHSDPLQLQTSEVASFQLDPTQGHCDVRLSNNNCTVTSNSFDDRVVLGSVGFSRGIHYWEFSVDRYEGRPDPSFGVAFYDVDKSQLLGKESRGWGMYIDESRSWLMHANEHSNRHEVGIKVGSRVGVLLDIARSLLSFYVDGKPQGNPMTLPTSQGNYHPSGRKQALYFPAISVNRNVEVTLHTGLRSPIQPLQLYRNRMQESSSYSGFSRIQRSPDCPHRGRNLSSSDLRLPSMEAKKFPPPPPIRRGGSTGNMSTRSDGESSDATSAKSLRSFFHKK